MWSIFSKFLRRDQGASAVEFILAVPILMTLLLGMADICLYTLNLKKVERVSVNLSDVITRGALTTAQLNTLLTLAPIISSPLAFSTQGVVIVTAVGNNGNLYTAWQYKGGGTLTGQVSKIAPNGGTPTLPTGVTLSSGKTMIFTEVFYKSGNVFFASLISPSGIIYQMLMAPPREGSLLTLQ